MFLLTVLCLVGALSASAATTPPDGLRITDVTARYAAPYLLDFEFSLRDRNDRAIVAPVGDIAFTCRENGEVISPNETAARLVEGTNKQMKCFLVLDYTNSVASVTANGDSNGDGRSDAIDAMEEEAKRFVDTMSRDVQIGIYEFHREDMAPQLVCDLSTHKAWVKGRIDSIWTQYVKGFPAASRCWDAVYAAVREFPADGHEEEQRYVIFLSDGRDESSFHTPEEIIAAARIRGVKIYSIGFGAELTEATLQAITLQTSGRYHAAADASYLRASFEQIVRDLRGQYILRWATLKRSPAHVFSPSFTISIGISDIYVAPQTYDPTMYAGAVTNGRLHFVGSTVVDGMTDVYLRASYVPRHITSLRMFIATPFAWEPHLIPAAEGGLCAGWSLQTEETTGGHWITLTSPDPQNRETAIPYATFGSILRLSFTDLDSIEALFDRNNFNAYTDNLIYPAGQNFTVAFFPGERETLSPDAYDTRATSDTMRFYRTILGRDALAEEIDAWVDGYFGYALGFDIDVRFVQREQARLFFFSDEYAARQRNQIEFLQDCYNAFLNREPTQEEIDDWVDGAWSRGEVLTVFAESVEFNEAIAARYPKLEGDPSRNFVTTMYIGLLDRLVDQQGLEAATDHLNSADDKLAQARIMARSILRSDEYRSRQPTHSDHVDRLYRAFLGRFPNDFSERPFWVNQLDTGVLTTDHLIDFFSEAAEFRQRIQRYFPGWN